MENAPADLGFARLSMFGPLTLPVATATVAVDAAPSGPIEYEPPLLSDRTAPPDPPPPRL
jgi:hypothetical protein